MNHLKYLFFGLLLLIFFAISCKNSIGSVENSASDKELVQKYLVEHSAQYISVKDGMVLRFKDEYANLLISNEVKGASVKPKIDGEFRWVNPGTLQFIPQDPLDYAEHYQISLDLPVLLEDPTITDRTLTWTFETLPLRYSIKIHGLKIDDNNGEESITISGNILSSDYADSETVEQILKSAQSDNSDLSAKWTHSDNGKTHFFEVQNVQQPDEKEGKLVLSWAGSKFDPSFSGKEVILIPAKSSFELSNVKISPHPERIIELYFSRPLNKLQNLAGLISIDKHAGNLRSEIDGNIIYIYPSEPLADDFTLFVSDKIKSKENKTLNKESLMDLRFDSATPEIRSIGGGMMVPSSSQAIFAFEAINLNAVDIEIFKIFDNNVLQFLQSNQMDEGYYLEDVGRIVWRDKVSIPDADQMVNQWTRVGINIKDYIQNDPGAIYQIRIGYQLAYAITDCDNSDTDWIDYKKSERSIMDYTDQYYYQEYEYRDDPCHSAYYSPDRFIRRNIMLSDVGVVIKGSEDHTYSFSLSHINTGLPLAGYSIKLFDFQKQLLVKSISSGDGLLSTQTDAPASFAIIEGKAGFGYVKLDDQNSNSLTEFDVAGKLASGPIDGFMYTDRGVHRPGDTIFLYFMLDDSRQPLPDLHPISLEVYDARSVKKFEQSTSQNVGKVYGFVIPTDANAPTGRWNATIKVGATSFNQSLRVESIKPNRLKIEVDNPKEMRYDIAAQRKIAIQSKWLHGSPANGLRAQMDVTLSNISPSFKQFGQYAFSDPARKGVSGINQWYDGKLDEKGKANVIVSIDPLAFPSKINAQIKTRVFEQGGNFSENYSSLNISPFGSYVGVKIPENRWGYKSVQIGEDAQFDIVSVYPEGNPVPIQKLTVGIYDIKWEWWYYQSDRYNIYQLNSAEHKEAFYTNAIKTDASGKTSLKVDFQDVEYGRKLIRICNTETGHCTGDFFYASGYGAPIDDNQREALSKLTFASDKNTYEAGEQVKVKIPSEEGSRILISIENEHEVILQEWIEGKKDITEYQFATSKSMAPNVYLHVTLIQSYDQKNNDLPIRMYGVIPIMISNKATHLSPVLAMPNELKPKEKFEIKVSETNKRSMTYTVAIVDEGLLDLTNFETPNPHEFFYAKKSLGVKTWDLYSHVLTGVSGEVDRMISVGGDDEGDSPTGVKKAIRFRPVVMTAGPFHLDAGQVAKHQFDMPNYMGSVRAMVIAREGSAYGSTDATAAVKKDIMILPTMPRVVSPGEEISIPVTVFATENRVKKVNITLNVDSHFKIIGPKSQEVAFDAIGEKVIYFKAIVNPALGIAQVKVEASGANMTVDQSIEIDVRNPNPQSSISYLKVLDPGEKWETAFEKQGMTGTNSGIIELSTLPSMKLEKRLDDLTSYPYGCIEQTTSAAMPQLYLSDVMSLDALAIKKVEKNINAAIRRIAKMQRSDGGFGYWPGASVSDSWGSSYAGHFLVLAIEKGYFVSTGVIDSWANYQKKQSRSFQLDRSASRWNQERQLIDQAYRLHVLALHGQPDLSGMNVLKQEVLPSLGQFLLAGAYAHAGKHEIAKDMVRNTKTEVDPYRELSVTYGSDLRDMALIAQTLMIIDRKNEASLIVKKIAEKLGSTSWYSTQSTSQAIIAVGEFLKGRSSDEIKASISVGAGAIQQVNSKESVFLFQFNPDKKDDQIATIENKSSDILYVSITMRGQKAPEEVMESAEINRNISLVVNYKNMKGDIISPDLLKRGTDFIAEVIVKNQNSRGPLLESMALSQIFPSGWEIQSGGLSNVSAAMTEDQYDYRDVRDDRVYTFFDLGDRKTFRILLTAAYDGTYFLPPVSCEAMYDVDIQARTTGRKVQVIGPDSDE